MKAMRCHLLPGTLVFWMLAVIINPAESFSQESIFSGLKGTVVRANTYFKNEEYKNALDLYLQAVDKNMPGADLELQIARTYYALNDFKQSASWFKKYLDQGNTLSEPDILKYAEALCGIHHYQEGIKWYTTYLQAVPDDELTMKKIWRLKNIRYLYEDSIYYVIKPLPINTSASELCPVVMGNELVFMSNRKTFGFNDRSNATNNMPFFKLFKTGLPDTSSGRIQSPKLHLFCPELRSKFHEGPVSFYENNSKMVYSATSKSNHKNEERAVLKLYFAEKVKTHWVAKDPFPYNSDAYSIMHPSITEDGKVLFFVSDMKGGFGKKDIYRSEYRNGQWSEPVNLGDQINTKENEEFPYIHRETILYFSSDGHPGFGGVDLFKTAVAEGAVGEIQNLGYPINNNSDDFGITLNTDGTRGFFSSNRNHGALDDDIFEVQLNLQTYPLVLQGLLKYKTNDEKDSTNLAILTGASLFVIDNVKQAVVSTTASDENGKFSIVIPYFSHYRIRVVEKDGSETTVSLDISKQRKSENNHEIVIVKDVFKPMSDKNE